MGSAVTLLMQAGDGRGFDLWIGLAIVALSVLGSIAQKAIQHFGGKKGEDKSAEPTANVPPVAAPPPWKPARRPSAAPPARAMPDVPSARPAAPPAARVETAPPAWQPARPAPRPAPPVPPPAQEPAHTLQDVLGRVAETLRSKLEQDSSRAPEPAPPQRKRRPPKAQRPADAPPPQSSLREQADRAAAAEAATVAAVESPYDYAAELRRGGAAAIRRAIIYSEVLGPPLSLREPQ